MISIRPFVVALAAFTCSASASAQPAPYRHWRTLETPHFRVHAAEGLEREGRVAGAAAERAYALLARELVAPRGPIELVVSDDADFSNGSATPFPTNRIIIFTTPPIESGGLALSDDWIGLVVTHELTHIFHLDRTRGIWAVGQRVFGRAPFLFPNAYSPSWLTEGLAVYYESRLTNGGRLRSAEHRTIARAAGQEHLLPQLGDLSLGNPRFPGGASVYSYGSLFIQYLAETHGDGSVPRFVERQSGALFPLLQEGAARRAFGTTLGRDFTAWRDSVERTTAAASLPLAGWRELAGRSFAPQNPRWLNDSTIVYTGSDGRSSTAAFTVTTSGRRTRLGRRSDVGANSPMPGGGLLFAQPEYVGTEEVRADLYVERDGVQRRLTHGARLTQPDVSGDGRIVAVELAAGRSSLVLLDSLGGRRVLREAGPDETWSEPRWALDGVRIAAIHRAHGGGYALEKLDAATGESCVMVRGDAILASPSWASARAIVYTNERSGAPQVEVATRCDDVPVAVSSAAVGIAAAEVNWRTGSLAASVLRADGYHLGLGDAPLARGLPRGELIVATPPLASRDTEPLAAGAYHEFDARRGLAPRYWLPIIEAGVSSGTRLGGMTSGQDAVGRHAYGAFLALETTGRFTTGGLAYRYAGLRRPLIDLSLSQDWTSRGLIVDSLGVPIGVLARRIQDLSLAATFARPRYRTYSSLSAGLGVERRRFASEPASQLAGIDPSFARDYTYPRAFVGASFSNAQQPRLAISREDGVSLGATLRERLRTDDASGSASTSLVGTAFGYKSLDLPGFAHHVLALRLAGGVADRRAVSSFEVGGTSGGSLDVVPGLTVGEGRRTFGVRGFPAASLYGTAAAAASVEYRAPLVVRGRGTWVIPAFFDRSSVSAFADAGTATCAASPLVRGICTAPPAIGRTIASVGGELGVSFAVFQVDAPQLLRLGVAVPVAGRALVSDNVRRVDRASVYAALGYSF
ncbi:MAG: WD40-like beta Propeller containing protein [Gemmatimonadetes bacterium]|nr:WD40-like beta Propeller containing protein [Gemmatimonadota bacterium]